MLYLLYGTKNFLIKEEIKKITKNFDDLNISKFDLANDDIKTVIDDCMTISLFDDKKIVICENADFFTAATSKDSEIIEQYINNQNQNTTLIFTVNNEKIDERKKITKLIKKNGTVKEFNENINPVQIIKETLKDYQIDNTLINLFIDRVGQNPLIIKQELEKKKKKVIDDFGIQEEKEEIRKWYDGYTIGNLAGIYNPWSILNYLVDRKLIPYWVNTSSNDLIKLILKSVPYSLFGGI